VLVLKEEMLKRAYRCLWYILRFHIQPSNMWLQTANDKGKIAND
jgi:hypothetical protein